MKKCICILILFLSLIIPYSVKAQNYLIQGKVTTIDGEPVLNARVWIINNNNIFEQFIAFTDASGMYSVVVTGIEDEEEIPTSYKLEQNYPNPFSEKTEIEFSAQADEKLTLKIYDILGREVKSLDIKSNLNLNHQSINWDGTNNNGNKVNAGVYFYHLSGRNISLTKKMLFIPGADNFSAGISSSYINRSIIEKENAQPNNYEIIVTNIESTLPLIDAQKIASVDLTADTTINFITARKSDPGYDLYTLCGDIIFVIDTYTNSFIDSIKGFDNYPHSFEITSNNKMYVSTDSYLNPSNIYSVDLVSKEIKIIKSFDYLSTGGYRNVFSKNHQDTVFVFTKNSTMNFIKVGIIENDSVKYFDSLDIDNAILGYKKQNVVFDRDSTVFYTMNTNARLFAYNYTLKKITRNYNQIYAPLYMLISDDNQLIYIAGGSVFDFHKDSVVAWIGGNRLGSLVLDESNSKLYITDPGQYYDLEYPKTGKVFGYRTVSYTYSDTIDVFKARLDYWKVTDEILIIPNTNLAYVSDFGSYIYIIDLGLNEVIGFIYIKYRAVSSIVIKKNEVAK
jgi:hypothetical protein